MPNEAEIEKMVEEKGLTAPRVSAADIDATVDDSTVEYVTHETAGGTILRWCVITLPNGYCIFGNPSAAVSRENDNEEIGQKVALDNARSSLWGLMGYALKEKIYQSKG